MAVIDLSRLLPPKIVDVQDFEMLLAERKACIQLMNMRQLCEHLHWIRNKLPNSCRKVPTGKFCCASVSMRQP